jgi:protein-S-isoprenylcysteine O-methyltransferase Ste14
MTVWSILPRVSTLVAVLWCLSEILAARLLRSKNDTGRDFDKASLRFLWLSIVPSLTLGILLGINRIGHFRGAATTISFVGFGLIVLGLIIRWIAMFTLRRSFTTDVSIRSNQELVIRGIYRFVRHPSYTGSLLSFAGLALSFASWVSLAVILIPITVAFLYRIRVEETVLAEHFGIEYAEYRKRTRRLLPLIY